MTLIFFNGPNDETLDCPDCKLPTLPLDDTIEVGARLLCMGCYTIYLIRDVDHDDHAAQEHREVVEAGEPTESES